MSTKLLNYWRWDHQFTWSSEPRKGLAIVRQRRCLDPFLILSKSIGSVPVGPSNRTRDLPLCSRVLHRLSYSPAADLATEQELHLTTGKRAKRTKLDFLVPNLPLSHWSSQDVFKRRTSTGSEAFSLLVICLDANKFVLLSFFSFIRTIYPRFSTKLQPNDAKGHIWLTSVAHKRCCLSSLITNKSPSLAGISIAKQMRKWSLISG